MNAKQLFRFFKGNWKLTRFAASGATQTIVMNAYGFACFRISLDHHHKLMYEENLEVNVSTTPITGGQGYIYFYDECSKALVKHFSSGSIFYPLRITENGATGLHKCADDSYSARYIFTNSSSFTLSYTALGPDKNYTVTTHYLRL